MHEIKPTQASQRASEELRARARRDYERALAASALAYERLEASPDTIEYQIDWNLARLHEAAAARRLAQADGA